MRFGLEQALRTGVLAAGLWFSVAAAWAQYQVKPWPAKQVMPAVSLQNLQGNSVKLDAYKGKTVVLNFWATWCEPCRSEMPSLAQLQEILGSDVVVVAANYKEGHAKIEQFIQSSGLKLVWLRDPDGAAAKALDVRIFPTTYIIGPSGKPLRKIVGEVDWSSADAVKLLKP
jgi:thiol-disulfide isomerase/thioredoxin